VMIERTEPKQASISEQKVTQGQDGKVGGEGMESAWRWGSQNRWSFSSPWRCVCATRSLVDGRPRMPGRGVQNALGVDDRFTSCEGVILLTRPISQGTN
jgi:hypothetical protein